MSAEKLSINDAKQHLYQYFTDFTGWKFLKSGPSLKKVVGDMVFEIMFFSSKYNLSGETIEVNCELRIWSKKLDKQDNINSAIGVYSFRPEDEYWYDISTMEKLQSVEQTLSREIVAKALDLVAKFEENYDNAMISLGTNENLHLYQIEHFKKNYDSLCAISGLAPAAESTFSNSVIN